MLSLSVLLLCFAACEPDGNNAIASVSDIDGNVYKTIRIGEQVWMAENLKVTKLNDGTPMRNFHWYRGNDEWLNNSLSVPMYTWPDSSDPNRLFREDLSDDYYGLMYSEAALRSGKLAPEGWRIPSYEDFKALEDYLNANGFQDEVGYALKSTTGWISSSANGSDDVGFNALPNGLSLPDGKAVWAQKAACFSGIDLSDNGTKRLMADIVFEGDMFLGFYEERVGAIRCIKK